MYGGDHYEQGASQFAGGGFLPSPGGQDGVSPAAKGGGRKHESLTPLTVCQLNEAVRSMRDDDTVIVDNTELHMLTLVGKVTDVSKSATMNQYRLDDGTGMVEVRHFLDTDDDAEMGDAAEASPIEVGMYVRAYGQLRAFQGNKNVIAYKVRPITDHNEITYHLLETTFVHLNRTKGGKASIGAGNPPTTPMATNYGEQNTAYQTPQPGGHGDMRQGGTGGGLEPVQQQLLTLFNEPAAQVNDAGLSIDDVNKQLNNKFTVQQIRTGISALVDEGHLYSTIDDNHFKSTTC